MAARVKIIPKKILREDLEFQESAIRPSKQKITISKVLSEYRLLRRKDFEEQISRKGCSIQVWIRYAMCEELHREYDYARRVWESALEEDYTNHTIWLKYAEFEMRNNFFTYARNVWERAVLFHPSVDQLWYKYIHMEEILGNIGVARQIFDRWMKMSPDEQAWLSFIKFELRYQEIGRARKIYKRYVLCHPRVSAYIQYAKFEYEIKGGEVDRARNVYERGTEKISADDEDAEMFFLAFSEFEEGCKEVERARFIYKFALDRIPKERAENLYSKFVAFEKQYGEKEGIEVDADGRRRIQYEDEVRKNPLNYDSWFDYVKLEETLGNKDRIREIYERAIANVPHAKERRYWQRYISLWINYALYEENEADDVERTRGVYRECLKLIPHAKFSFAKIWLLAAKFEIRQLNLTGARQILGNAIRKAPKDQIFRSYIYIELQLGNIDRCRKLYERYLEWSPENCYAWMKYTDLERSLGELERARVIFEVAISQPAVDMPELLWKTYIDFEISNGEFERTRALYERFLDRTTHCNMWVSFAKFETSAAEQEKIDGDQEEDVIEHKRDCARASFDRDDRYLKESAPELKD